VSIITLFSDTDSENRVLSAMMHDETACVEVLNALSETDFSDKFRHELFLLCSYIYKEKQIRPTYIEVTKEALTLGLLEGKKSFDELKDIAEHYIDTENIAYWIGKVKESSKARKAQQLLLKYSNIIETNKDINSLVDTMGSEFFQLAMDSDNKRIETGRDLAEYAKKTLKERVEEYRKQEALHSFLGYTPISGVPTGIPDLDRLLLGYQPGSLILMGAKTGVGKTAFAINTAKAVCIDNSESLFYINTEMTRRQLADRWGAILSDLPAHKIRAGSLTNKELDQCIESYNQLIDSGFLAYHEPELTPHKAQILTTQAQMQYKVKLMVLDYVGRMQKRDPRTPEWQMLEDIVKTQKMIAQNLNIACMVLFQLNDDSSIQGAKRMKNECDVMLTMHQIENKDAMIDICKYRKKKYEDFNYYIYVEKSRDSAAGIKIPIVFNKELQQIRQAKELGEMVTEDWSDIGREIKPKGKKNNQELWDS
jgi:replicative DNA helicase